jgi:hypothetical protein
VPRLSPEVALIAAAPATHRLYSAHSILAEVFRQVGRTFEMSSVG